MEEEKKTFLKELLNKERSYLSSFFDQLDLDSLEKTLEIFNNCQGILIFTGVGKSGLVAEKIALTLTSTGSRALFLSPTNALHGDLGIVHKGDLLIALSKSGETEELLSLIPFMRNRGVKVLSFVSNPKSRLAKASDHVLFLPVERELCPFDLAPTTSTVCQLIIGDILAMALMQLKNFSRDDFARFHPAGRIGKRITVKVRDLMLRNSDIPLCHAKDILMHSLVELSKKRCGCILIVDEEKKLLGIFTDGDLRRSLQTQGPSVLQKPMEELMTKTPRTINPDELAWNAMQAMESDQKHEVTVLPVVEEGKAVGLIKMHDIVQAGIA